MQNSTFIIGARSSSSSLSFLNSAFFLSLGMFAEFVGDIRCNQFIFILEFWNSLVMAAREKGFFLYSRKRITAKFCCFSHEHLSKKSLNQRRRVLGLQNEVWTFQRGWKSYQTSNKDVLPVRLTIHWSLQALRKWVEICLSKPSYSSWWGFLKFFVETLAWICLASIRRCVQLCSIYSGVMI